MFSWRGLFRRPADRLEVEGDVLHLTGRRKFALRIDAICRVEIYNWDQITTDLVCMDILTDGADGPTWWTVNEDLIGFEVVLARLEALPGFNRRWREHVIQPPFAEARLVVFDKGRAP